MIGIFFRPGQVREEEPFRVCLHGMFQFTVAAVVMDPEQVQPQGIADHTEAGQAHGRGAQHGIHGDAQQADIGACRHRNQQNVVKERPEKILQNIAVGLPAQTDCRGSVRQPALHKDDIGRVHGHIRARSDRDADICSGQGRRVVDSVADHGHPALFLQAADDGFLPVRQHIGDDLIDTGLAADGLSGPPVITGQHNDMDAHIAQLPDRLGGILLDGIRHRDNAKQLSFLHEQERGLPRF